MSWTYDLLIIGYFIVTSPYYLFQIATNKKYRAGLGQRLGLDTTTLTKETDSNKKRIWLHAVSVGEVIAAEYLINCLRKRFPSFQLVISTTTATGNKIAHKLAHKDDLVIYFPLDISCAVTTILDKIKPSIILLVETEIWPNFIATAHRRGTPILLVNGRLSPCSFRWYYLVRPLLKHTLKKIVLFCMQTENNADRIRKLGAPTDRICVTGNMKYEGIFQTSRKTTGSHDGETSALYHALGLADGVRLLVGGSTHRGEEQILVELFSEIKNEFQDLSLLLAPRHLERIPEIEKYLTVHNVPYRRKTAIESAPRVIILDTLGELKHYYRIATIVFIGKSLTARGGQNIIEPISYARPTLFGPHMENFEEVSQLLLMERGALQVRDGNELKDHILRLLRNPEEAQALGYRGQSVIEKNIGATHRTLDRIEEILKSHPREKVAAY